MMRGKGPASGQALIEFAFIIVVMALLALGVVDFSLAIQQAMLVQEAATEGALYASFVSYNFTQTDATQSVASVSGIGASGLTTVASYFCRCSPGGANVVCTSSCNNDAPMKYVQVQATSSFNSLIPYSLLPRSFNLTSTVVMPLIQ
jgi:Flp pilus assembly protein TadG